MSTQVPMGPVSIGVEVQRNTDGDSPSKKNHPSKWFETNP